MAFSPLKAGLIAAGLVIAVATGGTAVVLTRGPASPAPGPVTGSVPGPGATVPGPALALSPAPALPSFDVVRVSPTGSAVLAGRAEPMATVSVQSNGREIGQVHADGRGEWVFLPPMPLAPGAQQLALVSRGASGTDTRSNGDMLLVVPERPATGAAPAATEPVLAVLTPPAGPARVLQGPAAAPAGRLTLDVVDYDTAGQIRFTGAGPVDTPVRVYVDNAAVGDARTDGMGHWSLQPGTAMVPGVHALRVDQIGARGQVVSRVEMPFQRADLPSLEAGRVVVQPGQNLWRIARQAYGTGVRYTVIYRANQDQIRDPRRIYPGQAFNVPSSTGG